MGPSKKLARNGYTNPQCTVCRREDLEVIENERLNNNTPYLKMETLFGISHDTIRRHFLKCLKQRINIDSRVQKLQREHLSKQESLLTSKISNVLSQMPMPDPNEVKQTFELTLSQARAIETYLEDQRIKEEKDAQLQLTAAERIDKIIRQAERLSAEAFENNASTYEKAKTLQIINEFVKTLSVIKGETADPMKHPQVVALVQIYNNAIAGCQSCAQKVLAAMSQLNRP